MRVPLSWLREYVAVDVPATELAQRLLFASCEVGPIEMRGVVDADGNLEHYRVGRVLEAGKHPNADRLQLCSVDVGEAEPRQIVCGAWNFGAGATVAVALPGAVLPGGVKLERATLRGSVSDGMILSERELELGDDHAGIIVLPDEWEPGTPLADALPLSDVVLELETTHNRPDLLGVYGLAREVAAIFDLDLAPPPGTDPDQGGDEIVSVTVDDLEGCPRYIGRLFRDVRVGPSPPWLKARLVSAGMRPISNVVDVTNYVMLTFGSPLHAFDFDTLAGGRIGVRRAKKGEQLRTLDGQLRSLEPADLLITDGERPIALAGIMGGEETEVSEATTSVLLEAANFEPVGVMRSSERLRLRSEGSNRWEKGVDPVAAHLAATLASELFVDLCGARWTGEAEVRSEPAAPLTIAYRPARAVEVAGVEIDEAGQRRRLERLGFGVSEGWEVTVPTWRAGDVTREIDVVEEVARFELERVPATQPERRELHGRLTSPQRIRRRIQDVLAGFGFAEAYTWSLVSEEADPAGVHLPEPLSSEQAVLRTSLTDGLIAAAARNVDAGNEDIALFELAHVYLPSGEQLPDEPWHVGGIVEGGFARAKGVVESLYAALHVSADFERADDLPLPGAGARTAEGWLLQLADDRLPGEWGIFELDVDALTARVPALVVFEDVITYPAVKQDLAFSVPEAVTAGELVVVAREGAGAELREMEAFDVYRGEQVGEGRKSIAFRVVFQSAERTLSDEDAAALRERIVSALAERFGAELRA
ncbi:MAG TPA: phenylalanine--tRNA ligase subunit beta [Gaiellaceae bacterium]|nr:phenylalanine--tRNA ligase subunit beta [Gaiellaceae bacterium]